MTEATQTTFFRDFFGKEMSENSGLANQLTTGGRAKMHARKFQYAGEKIYKRCEVTDCVLLWFGPPLHHI